VTVPGRRESDGLDDAAGRLDPDAILEIYRRWRHDVHGFLLALTRDAELAEELLQATFSRLVESGHSARPPSVRGWLLKVAHNELRAWRRRADVHGRWLGRATPRAESEPLPWERLARGEDAERVRRALAELPAEQRAVVEARIHQGRPFAAIAAESGLPLGTVLTRMRLALEKLRRALGQEEGDDAR